MSIEEKDPALKALITEKNKLIDDMLAAGQTPDIFGLRREWKDIEKNLTPNSIDDTTTSKIQRKIDELQKKIQTGRDNAFDEQFLELAKKYLRLAYDYLGRMYGGGKRKSRKTNRKSLRKRKNTLTKRRYRK